jgi:hypothetical protein
MEVIEKTKRKKPYHLPVSVVYNSNEENKCIQMMHNGNCDDEPARFRKMEGYCIDNNTGNKNKGGCEFQYHQVRDNPMKAIYPKSSEGTPEFPAAFPNTWIRLQRAGNQYTGYYSTNGKSRKPFAAFAMELPSEIYPGLALTSHNPSHTASAKFRNIEELKQ